MALKKALIVDDSKSALLVLKRMLKELGLDVDTVESALDALDYLESHKPDVIFMDHMMPGMDGFEAIKHIKINPLTAVIPIMMYTSRAGDVYLSQARALGAVGIIPKTISPVGLKESLFKLGLIKDRRVKSTLLMDEPVTEKTDKQVVDEAAKSKIQKQVLSESDVVQYSDHHTFIEELEKLMDDQTVELHKSMWLGIESVSHEIFNRLNSEREKLLIETQAALQEKNKTPWPIYIASALLILSLVFNVRLFSDNDQLEENLAAAKTSIILTNMEHSFVSEEKSVEESLADMQEEVPAKTSLPDAQEPLQDFIAWAQNMVIEYPFNELALNDKRLPYIEALVKKALEAKYSGNIILQTHVGRFCMNRDPSGNYKLADDKFSITQCEFIGNTLQPDDAPSAHQSLSFAHYLSEINFLNKKSIEIEVTNISRTLEFSKYPEAVPQTTAEEWNLAAQFNNRIIVKLEPATNESEPQVQ